MSPRFLLVALALLPAAAGCTEEPRASGEVTVKGGAPIRSAPPPSPPPSPEEAPVEALVAQAAPEREPGEAARVEPPEPPPRTEPEAPAPATAEPEVAAATATEDAAVDEPPPVEAPEPVEVTPPPADEEPAPATPPIAEATLPAEPVLPGPFDVNKAAEILTDISLDGDFPLDGISVIDRKPGGPVPKGVEYVAWKDLSLRELYGKQLRAILSPEDIGQTEAADFPERIRYYDGKKIALLGFMVPLEWDGDHVPELMLVRDLMSCCFGGVPMPDEWMHVKMVGKAKAEYYPYVPVLVTGTLRLGGFEDEAGYTVGCYRLEAVSLEEEAGW